MKIDLPPDIKVLMVPTAALVVLIGLCFVLMKFGLAKFMTQQQNLADTQKQITTLSQKDEILRQISATVSGSANAFSLAIPDSNPTEMVISQVKALSAANSVAIVNISSRPDAKGLEGISQVNINVSISGSVPSILSFLNSLATVSPLVVIKNADLAEDKLLDHTADITLSSYWSAFPTTIPAAADATGQLTPNEEEMITRISGLTPPSFTQLTPQSPSDQRSNPF